MKNKKAEQAAKRAAQKAARRKKPKLNRKAPSRIEKQKILIVCEGKNTEPSYFNQFRLSTATIKAIGDGYNTVSLIRQAHQLSLKDKYDQVWCVFDKDGFSDTNYNNAIDMAIGYGFKLAYSNQAFEYWLILHFEDHQGGAMNRKDYDSKINTYLKPFGIYYDGSKKGSKKVEANFFNLMLAIDPKTGKSYRELAKNRAIRNLEYHTKNGTTPAQSESCTLVHHLVIELEKFT